jgi:hypothetical protein
MGSAHHQACIYNAKTWWDITSTVRARFGPTFQCSSARIQRVSRTAQPLRPAVRSTSEGFRKIVKCDGKLSACLIMHYVLKVYGEVEGYLHAFFTSAVYVGNWATSRLGRFIFWENYSDSNIGQKAESVWRLCQRGESVLLLWLEHYLSSHYTNWATQLYSWKSVNVRCRNKIKNLLMNVS